MEEDKEPISDELIEEFANILGPLMTGAVNYANNPPPDWTLPENESVGPIDKATYLQRQEAIEQNQLVYEYEEVTSKHAKRYLNEIASCLKEKKHPSEHSINYFCKAVEQIMLDEQNEGKKIKSAFRLVEKKGAPTNLNKNTDIYLRVEEEIIKGTPISLEEGGVYQIVGDEFFMSSSGCKSAHEKIKKKLQDKALQSGIEEEHKRSARLFESLWRLFGK